jgi:hypothetical protein
VFEVMKKASTMILEIKSWRTKLAGSDTLGSYSVPVSEPTFPIYNIIMVAFG